MKKQTLEEWERSNAQALATAEQNMATAFQASVVRNRDNTPGLYMLTMKFWRTDPHVIVLTADAGPVAGILESMGFVGSFTEVLSAIGDTTPSNTCLMFYKERTN